MDASAPSSLRFEVDAQVYDRDVVMKCVYWYTGAFDVHVSSGKGGYIVEMTPRESPLSADVADATRARFLRDLIDHQTRSLVARETATVRELLIAKAFAHEAEGIITGAEAASR